MASTPQPSPSRDQDPSDQSLGDGALSDVQLAAAVRVLQHPQHTAGLDLRTWTVRTITPVGAHLVRVAGTLSGDHEGWTGPNVAVRLELPYVAPEFAAIDGAPDTVSRVYTVADFDVESGSMAVDFVLHGGDAPAMRWLAESGPGTVINVKGPRPHQLPVPGDPQFYFADSSAIPALRTILQAQADAAEESAAHVVVAPNDPTEVADLPTAVTVVHAGGDTPLTTAARNTGLPVAASVWAAGERADMRALRRLTREELGIGRDRLRLYSYWTRGVNSTKIDIARLVAAKAQMDRGKNLFDADDLDLSTP